MCCTSFCYKNVVTDYVKINFLTSQIFFVNFSTICRLMIYMALATIWIGATSKTPFSHIAHGFLLKNRVRWLHIADAAIFKKETIVLVITVCDGMFYRKRFLANKLFAMILQFTRFFFNNSFIFSFHSCWRLFMKFIRTANEFEVPTVSPRL